MPCQRGPFDAGGISPFHQVAMSEGEVVVFAFAEQGRRSNAIRFIPDEPIEIGLADLSEATWHKSSYSACNGNCVEVAGLRRDLIGVRDTKDAGYGSVLVFEGAAWRSFIDSVKNGS